MRSPGVSEQRSYGDALRQVRKALAPFRAARDELARANALTTIGWCHANLGHHLHALAHSLHALCLQRELGNSEG